MEDSTIYKRQSIRFSPDPNTLVYIKRIDKPGTAIDNIGLVSIEAGKGFACITLKNEAPIKDDVCLVKVGELHPMKARVASLTSLDQDSVKIGFEYLE